MNFNKFINSDYLKNNPLCGISTYKDELNLATGACTRKIKKLVLDGTEWWYNNSNNACCVLELSLIGVFTEHNPLVRCSHVPMATTQQELFTRQVNYGITLGARGADRICIRNKDCEPVGDFKAWLAAEYANGTPVTVWYVLETPTTETITVPSGLSGTEEGYLNQSGTPTPTNPIYPTANTVEKWFDINHYIMGTDTDTITTLPADIYANDTTATVGLKGNMEQSSQPSPSSPVMPQETGDETANLWNAIKYTYTSLSDSSVWVYSSSLTGSVYRVPCMPNTKYTLYLAENVDISIWRICEVSTDVAPNASSTSVPTTGAYATAVPASKSATFTTSASAQYILFQTNEAAYDSVLPVIMLIEGASKIPYEPFGVKIPISSANTTTPVYLGEVETTRKIRKLVLTGSEDENWNTTTIGINDYIYRMELSDLPKSGVAPICTHYTGSTASRWVDIANYEVTTSILNSVAIRHSGLTGVSDWKSYLQQQYAAGTPVTVWYVMTEPETAVVSEPLMRIGDYADEVSGITIPTIAGADSFDVQTTLKPSEVELTYTGWHDASVKEWNGSEWQ